MGAKGGDLVLMIADKPATVARALGELRLEMARRMNMIDQDKLAFTWVTDFPMFEYNEDEKTLCCNASSVHNATPCGS